MDIEVLSVWADNYIYLLTTGATAVVVDPGVAAPVVAALQLSGGTLSHILLTHRHRDHTGGVAQLRERYGSILVEPQGEGDTLEVGELFIRVLSVPGHTADDVAYWLPREQVVFTGDTLFCGGCGRLGCDAARMWASLQVLRDLPDDTRVYCGHEYTVDNLEFALDLEPDHAAIRARLTEETRKRARGLPTVPSTIGLEKQTNPFLRADTEAVRRAAALEGADPVDVFRELRRRKDRW